MKIGWVNTQKILTEYEDVNKIYAEVEKEKTRLDREFQNKQTTLDSLIQDYQTKKLLLSEEAVKSMEQLINSLQLELQLFILNVNSPQGELAVFFNEKMAPIEGRIYNDIQKVAMEHEYDYVLDCSTGECLFQLEANNLTGFVQDELKKMALDSLEP